MIYHSNTASIDFNFNQFARFIILALVFLLMPGGMVSAQGTNPTPAACGLPVAGNIVASVTYTLNADCTQTGALNIATPPAGQPGYTLTIDGAGHTIKLAAGTFAFASVNVNDPQERNSLVLRNLTLDGQAHKRPGVIHGPMSAENVTFRNHNAAIITSASIALTNVLFASNQFVGLGFGANGGTLNIAQTGSATVTNAVFRDNRTMNIVLHPGAALTTEGCLTFSGNLAYNVVHSGVWSGAGDWIDNSTGECSGEIGNKGQAVLPEIRLMPCGLPAGLALIDTDTTFTLRRDCDGVTDIVVSEGKRVTIRGNGYRISRNESLPAVFQVAGDASLTISDAILDKAQLVNYGTLTVSHSEMRNSLHLGLINYGTASFGNMLFQDNSAPSFAGLYYGGALFLKGIGTFSDSKFDGVSGSDAALRADGSTVVLNLNGCIVFDGLADGYPETVAEDGATLNDNRDPAACNPRVGPRPPVNPENPSPAAKEPSVSTAPPPPSEICDGKPGAVLVGSVACVFRHEGQLVVYGLDARSRGFFMTSATQAQIDAACPGLVASSPDGRAAIFAEAFDNVSVAVGPDFEGKVLHITLAGGIYGEVISLFTTYGPPPGLVGPPGAGAPFCAKPLSGCMVRTKYIVNFRDAPDGSRLSFVDVWGFPNDGMLPDNVTLTALERTSDWFKVDNHGTRGWISAYYVEPIGTCG